MSISYVLISVYHLYKHRKGKENLYFVTEPVKVLLISCLIRRDIISSVVNSLAKNTSRLFAEQAWRRLSIGWVTKPVPLSSEMQFPVVRATIKFSPPEQDRRQNTGSLFVVKEVKSANQRQQSYGGSKVVEVSVPREELKSRVYHGNKSPLSSVPLIELNINRTGFQVRSLVWNVVNMREWASEMRNTLSHNILNDLWLEMMIFCCCTWDDRKILSLESF